MSVRLPKIVLAAFAVVCGMQHTVAAEVWLDVNGVRFANADAVADQLDLKFELVERAGLGTFCSRMPPATCIPVRLNSETHVRKSDAVFLRVTDLQTALSIEVEFADEKLTVRRRSLGASDDVASSTYHAAWGKGRGFNVGQTVPDIPLLDMNGKEVRFSRFLGKRYILYCWASW
ncbi:MAG: hypothetical protein Fues2KO_21600 [Fuerstiella sp.]